MKTVRGKLFTRTKQNISPSLPPSSLPPSLPPSLPLSLSLSVSLSLSPSLSLALSVSLLHTYTQVFSLHDQPVNIAFSLCLFGFFALPLIPACMELGVEITYPVAEATSSGLLWSFA